VLLAVPESAVTVGNWPTDRFIAVPAGMVMLPIDQSTERYLNIGYGGAVTYSATVISEGGAVALEPQIALSATFSATVVAHRIVTAAVTSTVYVTANTAMEEQAAKFCSELCNAKPMARPAAPSMAISELVFTPS
jgi:hypothetical protein